MKQVGARYARAPAMRVELFEMAIREYDLQRSSRFDFVIDFKCDCYLDLVLSLQLLPSVDFRYYRHEIIGSGTHLVRKLESVHERKEILVCEILDIGVIKRLSSPEMVVELEVTDPTFVRNISGIFFQVDGGLEAPRIPGKIVSQLVEHPSNIGESDSEVKFLHQNIVCRIIPGCELAPVYVSAIAAWNHATAFWELDYHIITPDQII